MRHKAAFAFGLTGLMAAVLWATFHPKESHLLRFRPIPGHAYVMHYFDKIDDPAYKSKVWRYDAEFLRPNRFEPIFWTRKTVKSAQPVLGSFSETLDDRGDVSVFTSYASNDLSGEAQRPTAYPALYAFDFPYPENPVSVGDHWSGSKVHAPTALIWCDCRLERFLTIHGRRAAEILATQWLHPNGSGKDLGRESQVTVDIADGVPLSIEEGGTRVAMPQPGTNTSKPGITQVSLNYFVEVKTLGERAD